MSRGNEVFCDKLSQWLGDRDVCGRRKNIPGLYVDCVGCDCAPLITIPTFVGSRLVFNDPPKGGYKTWRSGDQLVGDPDEVARELGLSCVPVVKKQASPSRLFKSTPKVVDKIDTAELITEEAKK